MTGTASASSRWAYGARAFLKGGGEQGVDSRSMIDGHDDDDDMIKMSVSLEEKETKK